MARTKNPGPKTFDCWHSSGASLVATRCSVKGFFTHVDNQSPIKRRMLGLLSTANLISGDLSRDELGNRRPQDVCNINRVFEQLTRGVWENFKQAKQLHSKTNSSLFADTR
jgi:hypothetical protein